MQSVRVLKRARSTLYAGKKKLNKKLAKRVWLAKIGAMTTNRTIKTGNNESLSKGIYKQADGTFLVLTFSASKTFKTLAGAQKWMARRA